MKKFHLLLVFVFAFFLNGWSQADFTITGSGFGDFKQVTLKVFNPSTLGYDSLQTNALAESGRFVFHTLFKTPNLYELSFDEKDFVHLSIESPQPVSVRREGTEISISGSLSSQQIIDFQKRNEQLQAKHFGQLKVEMDKAMQENNQTRMDAIQKEAETAIQNFLVEFRALIVGLGASPAAYFAMQYSDFNKELDFLENRLEVLKKEAPNMPTTLALEKQVYQAKTTGIGKTPPDFQAVDRNGQKRALSDFRGQIILLDFWAYWCRACRVENPKLVRVYQQFKDKGVTILSISQRSTQEQWEDAIEKDGIGIWSQVLDKDNEISALYSISSLPQNLLLDQTGKVIAKNITAAELEVWLRRILE